MRCICGCFPQQTIPLLAKRIQESNGLVLHVIAPFYRKLDWDDLESTGKHKTMTAFDRTKNCNRVIAAELARRYKGKISSVAFDPTYVIDKSDPELSKRWPSGLIGFLWRLMTLLTAKPTAVAGKPMAELILSENDRSSMNGALIRLYKRVNKPDKAMTDEALGKRLWEELVLKTDKTLPKATALAVISVIVIYLLVTIAAAFSTGSAINATRFSTSRLMESVAEKKTCLTFS